MTSHRSGTFVLAIAAALGLAACSSHSAAPLLPSVAEPQRLLTAGPNTGFGSWAYTCLVSTDGCPLYTVSGTSPTLYENANINGNPVGEFATTAGNWYVALKTMYQVVVYKSTASGPTGPYLTLNDPNEIPDDVTVNTAHKMVVVGHLYTESGNRMSMSVFLNGAKTPTKKLYFSAPGGKGGYGIGVATDSSGNCYFSVDDAGLLKFDVVKFTACGGSGKIVYTSAADTSAGGLALDGSNNLYFVDTTDEYIYRCKGTSSCKVLAKGFQGIIFVRFDAGWKHLWTTDGKASKLYALNPTTGAVLSSTTEINSAGSLALAPGPAY